MVLGHNRFETGRGFYFGTIHVGRDEFKYNFHLMTRSILAIINQISAEIPTWYDTENRMLLEKTFLNLRRDIRFTAPEQLPDMWGRLGLACHAYLPDPNDPDAPWATRVSEILCGSTSSKRPGRHHSHTISGSIRSDESASGEPLLGSLKSESS